MNRLHSYVSRRVLVSVSLIGIAGILASAASPATAQVLPDSENSASADNGAPSSDEGVLIVTAQFRDQRLQDTPLAITALTGEMLDERGQTTLTDLHAPNLTVEPAPGIFGPAAQIYIRGVGQFDTNFTFEPGVGVYIDGVYYSTVFGNAFDLLDLERVEVLRGPQGTLAGKNSIGGAIRLFSRQPNGEESGFVEATAGSYDRVGVRAGADLTIVPDRVFARISGSARHIRGYIDRIDFACANPGSPLPTLVSSGDNSCRLGRLGGSDQVGLRGQLRLLPAEDLEINLSADFFSNRGDPGPSILIEAREAPTATLNGVSYGPQFESPNPYVSYATYRGTAGSSYDAQAESELTAWGVAGTIDYFISDDVRLKSITAYRSTDAYFVVDNDESPIPKSESIGRPSQEQFTQELRLSADLADLVDLTVGGFYYNGDSVQGGRNLIGSINADFLTADTIESESSSVFAHAVFHVTEDLNLTAGIRYTDDRKIYTFVRSTVDGSFSPAVTPIDGQSATFSEEILDYRAVIDYRWSPSFFTYAQFSTGFKGGGVNPRVFFPNQVAAFGEERLNAYEIGFKFETLDRRLRLNVSAFLNDYSNIQIQTNTAFFNVNLPVQPDITLPNYNPPEGTFPAAVFLNGGDVEQTGVEAELTLDLDRLQINASVSYLEGHYTDLLPQAIASGLTADMELPFAPGWQADIGVQYEIDVPGGTLTPRLDYHYQSSTFASAINDPRNRLESRNILNARLTYRTDDEDWEATLGVTNLTEDFFYYSRFDIFSTGGYVTGVPSRPREWSLSVARHF
jgi:iron complex outermembrane receptor protein